jgi:phospholipid/cholesterol/gamma-HCH transport system substrate-binding protein
MTSKSGYMMVGAFVLILSTAFVWGILWISAGGAPQNFDRYVVYMTGSVSGLNVDAPLKYRGVDVGKVEQIGIDPKNPERIRLLLQVRQGTPVKEDTVASLEYQGLTGIANVNLSGGKADSADLKRWPGEDYPVITGRPSIFSNLDTTLEGVVGTLMETSAGINAMLSEENRSNIARSIENVAVLTESFAQQANHLETIVAHLETTLENAREASVDLPHMVQEFTRSAEAVTQMADEIRGIGENLSAASARIEETVDASSDGLVDFSRTTLPEITEMIYELKKASENLRRMSEDLARNPSMLIYGASEPEPGPGE